jgi:hypothetical protein
MVINQPIPYDLINYDRIEYNLTEYNLTEYNLIEYNLIDYDWQCNYLTPGFMAFTFSGARGVPDR